MYGIYENGAVIAKFTAPMTVRSNQPILVSDTLSLDRQTAAQAAQRWEIETGLEPLTAGSQDLFVHLVTKGAVTTFDVLMPQNYGVILARSQKTSSGFATGASRSTQVVLRNVLGFIPKGTFIQFGNHPKVYMTTNDRSNGQESLNIYPGLRVPVNDTEIKYGDDVIFKCRYDTDVVRGMVYSDGILMSTGSVRLVESLRG